ncbi:MAG: carboxypeptidase regulatory-like domain-containing protein [Gemmatimonadota bacterium]
MRILAVLALMAGGIAPAPALAQSIVRGELQGSVREAGGGEPLASVAITLTGARTVFTETNRSGEFSIARLHSGDYDLRVEAPGFIPRLVRGVRVGSGQSVQVGVELAPAPPPVVTVDTVSMGPSGEPRFDGLGGRWIPGAEIRRFSDPRMSLSRLADLGVSMDEAFGSEGLPGELSTIVMDGVPFPTARHPEQRGMGDLPLLPRIGLSSVDVHRHADVEWSGAAGSYVAGISRRGTSEPGFELFGSASAASLWQSEGLDDGAAPSGTSGWGGGAAHLPLDESGSTLFVGAEGLYGQTPHPSPVSSALASRLASASPSDPELDAAELTEPWMNELRAISGLTRLDWAGESTEVTARASFSTLRQGGSELFARPLDYGSIGTFDGTDATITGSILTEISPDLRLEARMGLQRSSREWGGLDTATEAPLVPPTRFVTDGVLFGPRPGLAGTVERTTFLATGVLHFDYGQHRVKTGLQGMLSSYDYDHLHASAGSFLFGAPGDAQSGEGAFVRIGGSDGSPVPAGAFNVPEIGLFIQHQWNPGSGLRLISGVRFDYETLPVDEVVIDRRWLDLTGIRNDRLPDGIPKFSPRVTLEWDPSAAGTTRVSASVAVQYDGLDPGAMNEVVTAPRSVRAYRRVGGLESWPALPTGGGASTTDRRVVALFGPEPEAPRTARATAGLTQRIGENAVIGISGTFRRTEFLLRRDDLNLSLAPGTARVEGRPLWGHPVKSGSVIVADPGSNRRFEDRDSVWSLNSDGWSEYTGLTLSAEVGATDRVDLFGSYTFSSTEDNLLGSRIGIPEAALSPRLDADLNADWDEGTSDYDVPHRITAGALVRFPVLEGLEASGVYRFRSGLPFTAGYRPGVDINADGSSFNDPALVPSSLAGLEAADASCLSTDLGSIATRNECRGEAMHHLDLHFSLGLFRLGNSVAALTLDVFNVTDVELGPPDTALLLVREGEPLEGDAGSDRIGVPLDPNPTFGEVTQSFRPGRLLRVGFSVEVP